MTTLPELVVFEDIEAVLVTYLATRLTGWGDGPVTVATNVDDPRPDRLVKVTRTGGTQRDRITDLAQVTFECWAPNEPEASKLIRWVRAYVAATGGTAVDGPAGPVWIRSVSEAGGPAFLPDPDTRLPRYQFTVQINLSSHRPVPTPDTETLSFDWELWTEGSATPGTVDLFLMQVGGTLPAGSYHITYDGLTESKTLPTDYISPPRQLWSAASVPDRTSITVSVTGPWDIAFAATGVTDGTGTGAAPAVIDSDAVTYTRPVELIDRLHARRS